MPSSNDRARNCVTEIITSHDLSPPSSPTKAVEKLRNRYAGARGNRMEERRKEETHEHRGRASHGAWNKSEGNRRRKGRNSKKRPEGLLAECGLEKWGHVFSVKLLESLARSSAASSCFARSAFTRSQRSFNWLAWIYRKAIFRLIFRFVDTGLFILVFVFIVSYPFQKKKKENWNIFRQYEFRYIRKFIELKYSNQKRRI